MNSILKLILVALILFVYACKPSPQRAETYYSKVFNPLQLVVDKENTVVEIIKELMVQDSASIFNETSAADSVVKIKLLSSLDSAYMDFLQQVKLSKKEIETLDDFDNQKDLKEVAIELLLTYESVVTNEYSKMITIAKIPLADYSNEDDNTFFALSDSADIKLQDKISDFSKAATDFSKEYKFQIPEDTVQSY